MEKETPPLLVVVVIAPVTTMAQVIRVLNETFQAKIERNGPHDSPHTWSLLAYILGYDIVDQLVSWHKAGIIEEFRIS